MMFWCSEGTRLLVNKLYLLFSIPYSDIDTLPCKPLFIIHGELRPFKTYTGVQKQSTSARKVGMAHALRDCMNANFQVSV